MPTLFQAVVPDEQPSFAFGVKHSPYIYKGKEQLVTQSQQQQEEFRPRSGTYTRDKPTILRTAAQIKQAQAVA